MQVQLVLPLVIVVTGGFGSGGVGNVVVGSLW